MKVCVFPKGYKSKRCCTKDKTDMDVFRRGEFRYI